MNSRERIRCALAGKQPDRVPIFDWVNNPALYTELLGVHPGIYDGALAVRLARALGLDAAWAPAGGFMGLPSERWQWAADRQSCVDEWGTTYRLGEGSWPLAFPQAHPVKTRTDWERIAEALPDGRAEWRLEYARAAVAEARRTPTPSPPAGDLPPTPLLRGEGSDSPLPPGEGQGEGGDLAVFAGIRGPFSSAWMLMGLQEMSLALADDPALLEAIFDATAAFWAEVGLALAAAGVDAIVVHDDQGSGTSTFFSPARFRRHVLPYLAREIQALAAAGVPVILHSCGNVNAILPELVSTGIAGLNNLQRAARMDLGAVKAAYGNRLCLIGNVDATNVMPYASPEEIETAVVECLWMAAPGGRFILATDHSFHEGIPIDNVRAFVAAGKKHGSYING